jgi:hypothetical protein
VESNVEPVGGEEITGAFRPFDEDERAIGCFFPPELCNVFWFGDPEKIGMYDRMCCCLVDLHQSESGAWHFELGITAEEANERAREGRFAGAKVPRQSEEIARVKPGGDVACQCRCRGLVAEIHTPNDLARRCIGRLSSHRQSSLRSRCIRRMIK